MPYLVEQRDHLGRITSNDRLQAFAEQARDGIRQLRGHVEAVREQPDDLRITAGHDGARRRLDAFHAAVQLVEDLEAATPALQLSTGRRLGSFTVA